MIIAFEGLDGCGKSTQASMLENRLRSGGTSVKLIHFPQYDSPTYGRAIKRFLNGDFGSLDDVHPWLVATLFAGDRIEAAEELRKLQADGTVLLIDRYLYSNHAFQAAKLAETERADFHNWLWQLETERNHVPVPDVSIFLDAPTQFISHRLANNPDIHEQNAGFQDRVRQVYLDLVRSHEQFVKVDCVIENEFLQRQDIHEHIWRLTSEAIDRTMLNR